MPGQRRLVCYRRSHLQWQGHLRHRGRHLQLLQGASTPERTHIAALTQLPLRVHGHPGAALAGMHDNQTTPPVMGSIWPLDRDICVLLLVVQGYAGDACEACEYGWVAVGQLGCVLQVRAPSLPHAWQEPVLASRSLPTASPPCTAV